MPLDPQARAVLDQLAALDNPPLEEMTVEQARQGLSAYSALSGAGPAVDRVEDLRIPGPGGDIPARAYSPPAPGPLVLWFHGGGWVLGGLEDSDALCRTLCNEVGAVVVSVDYRLAPEHPFPAAVDDCMAATAWAVAHAGDIGADGTRVAVAGDSAGGNLAAVTALGARDDGGPQLSFQLLVYPVTDASMTAGSIEANGEGYFLTAASMRWFWDLYVPKPSERTDPRASPLAAEDMAGLPPTLVITAEFDPLRDEGEAYGRRLAEAGVPTQVSRYDGMIHGFLPMASLFDAAGRATDEAADALRRALAV